MSPRGRGAAGDSQGAADAVRLVQTDPHRARRVAGAVLARARENGDAAAASTAQRALGLVARELGDYAEAAAQLTAAIDTAERAKLRPQVGEARMSLSLILAFRGDTAGALRQADLAGELLRGAEAGAVLMQRAAVLQVLGRLDEAHQEYGRALAAIRRSGDRLREARCLNNRGLLYVWRDKPNRAEADLRSAEGIFADLGQDLAVADVSWNLGIAASRRGDVPTALAAFDAADDYYARNSVPRAHLLIYRCELLLGARLLPEARKTAELALAELGKVRRPSELAQAQLMASHAALLEGDGPAALTLARSAEAVFARLKQTGWRALAGYAALRARLLEGSPTRATLAAALKASQSLKAAGWVVPALDARVQAARVAMALNRPDVARRELTEASGARRIGPVELRISAWHAEALLRLSHGDQRGADSALRAGYRALDQHRGVLGATELRAHASTHAAELAALGLRLAMEANRPERVLEWAERWRAGALLLRPVRPPDDAELAGNLAELRGIVAALETAALGGRATADLLRRQAATEQAIRRHARRAPGAGVGAGRSLANAPMIREALGDAALVELIGLDGDLHAVVVAGRTMVVHRLSAVAEVVRELEALAFAMRRLARGKGSEASLAAAGASAAHGARQLDRLVLAPISGLLGDRALVIVPTGALHALPWSLLPSCASRPVTVAPSAAIWHRAAARPGGDSGGSVVLAAGPGLPGADAEVRNLRRTYEQALSFSPETARVQGVMDAADGARLVHIAAHGRFRSDNPLFSSLQLADGPLTVYDLERLRAAPRCLVLSACVSGLSAIRPGDELMGLASAVFALGTRTLIASVVEVPDEAARRLMLAFHRLLQTGAAPAAALAEVQAKLSREGGGALATSGGFVCFGSGGW